MCAITKPVWCFFHGYRFIIAQKMLAPSVARMSANHHVRYTSRWAAGVPWFIS
jgi:hypothetical protein